MIPRLCQCFPPGIRLQLACWYTAAFAVLLLLTGAVFYQYLEHALEASVDTALQLRAEAVAGGIVIRGGIATIQSEGLDPSNSPLPLADVNAGALVRVLDVQGKLLFETPAFRTLQVPAQSWTMPREGKPWQATVLSASRQEVRLYSRTLTSKARMVAIIQVGEPLSSLHVLLHELVGALLVVGGLVLLACAAGSYWLAARSFAPIQRLAETARRIKAGDLHQRVPVPQAHDEIQYLALTLNEMIEKLDQSFSRQRQFVADASHELRTPVAVIRTKAGIALLEPPRLDEAVTALSEIVAETERLSLLLTDLLTLARGDEGQAHFEQEGVQLDLLVETVAATTEVLAAERGLELTVQVPHPVAVVGDEARLIQVVMNLLDNAIRSTNPGGQIWVSVEQMGDSVRLMVHDTGIGIAPEHLPHIFERFYRADPSRRWTGGSSSGLGLSIVEWIVRMHDGSVGVSSQVGQGSCFTVTLPLTPLRASQDMPTPPEASLERARQAPIYRKMVQPSDEV
jgi:heavy metal sensor kinase